MMIKRVQRIHGNFFVDWISSHCWMFRSYKIFFWKSYKIFCYYILFYILTELRIQRWKFLCQLCKLHSFHLPELRTTSWRFQMAFLSLCQMLEVIFWQLFPPNVAAGHCRGSQDLAQHLLCGKEGERWEDRQRFWCWFQKLTRWCLYQNRLLLLNVRRHVETLWNFLLQLKCPTHLLKLKRKTTMNWHRNMTVVAARHSHQHGVDIRHMHDKK